MKNLPFWLPRKNNFVWYMLIIGLFILSLDFWDWGISEPLILGLPFWVFYLFIITISLAFVFFAFSKFYWRDDE